MSNTDLKAEILAAIVAKDKPRLRELKAQLERLQWLNQFNGSIAIAEWLKPNPFIEFE